MARENSSIRPTLKLAVISESDTVPLGFTTRGLSLGTSGDVNLILEGMSTPVVVPSLAAGIIHPIACKHVYATSTTATGLVGWYDPPEQQA